MFHGGKRLWPLAVLVAVGVAAAAEELPATLTIRSWGLKVDAQGHNGTVANMRFTADGKSLISIATDRSIRVWDVASGQQKYQIRGKSIIQNVMPLAICSGKGFLAVVGDSWFVGEGADDRLVDHIRVFDVVSGRVLKVLAADSFYGNGLIDLAFTADGSTLVSADSGGLVRTWSTADWKPGSAFAAVDGSVACMDIRPDGREIVLAHGDGTIATYSLASGVLCWTNTIEHSGGITCIRYSPNGKNIATSTFSGDVDLWTADRLDWIDTVKRVDFSPVSNLDFLDPNTLAIACGGGKRLKDGDRWYDPVYLLDLRTGKERVFKGNESSVQCLRVSPDGRTVASSNGSVILLWSPETLARNQLLAGKGASVVSLAWTAGDTGIIAGTNPTGTSVADTWRFSFASRTVSADREGKAPEAPAPEGGYLPVTLGGPRSGSLRIGDFSVTLPNPQDTVHAWRYSADGKLLFVGSGSGLYCINVAAQAVTRNYSTIIGSPPNTFALAISGDGKTLAAAGSDQILRFYDISDAASLNTAHFYSLSDSWQQWIKENHPEVRPNNWKDMLALYRQLVAAGRKDARELLSPLSESPILNLFVATDHEWVAWIREGYYDCSLDGARYAGWYFNHGEDENAEFFDLEQYASVFYRPDVIGRTLARAKFDPPVEISAENRPPQITSFKINGQAVFDEGEITITTDKPEFIIELACTGTAALRQPELFYNGRVISQGKFKGPPEVKLADDRWSLTARYSFTVGNPDNRYRIFTVDERGFKSAAKTVHVIYTGKDASPAFYKLGEKVARPKSGGTLYVLSVGVNRYSNPGMAAAGMGDLKYAEKDAADMAALWAGQQGKLFDKVETTVLTKSSLGRDVTQADIIRAFSVLGTKATRDTDSVLIFLSGHGLRKDEGFYYLSSEADPTSKQSLDATSPSWIAIGNKLKSLTRAKEIVVLVDACHSGAINPTELGFTWKDKGVVLITSSRAGQKSYEGGTFLDAGKQKSVFENGLFTKAIVEGFGRIGVGEVSAPADTSQDNVLIVGEVLEYAIRKVGLWTNEQQTPWVPAYDPAIEGKVLGVVK